MRERFRHVDVPNGCFATRLPLAPEPGLTMPIDMTMSALVLEGPGSLGDLRPTKVPHPKPGKGEALVRVCAAAVNPSDVLNVIGLPITVYPRVPGRDFAGVVLDGPVELISKEVWGTGSGDLGFTRDGSHAELLVITTDALVPRPSRFSMVEAGASGLSYVTALAGLKRANLAEGMDVLITGAAGGVGSAAASIACWRGARVVAAVMDAQERARVEERLPDARVIETGGQSFAQAVHDARDGRGVDLAFDTIGAGAFNDVLASLADDGVMVTISAKPQVEVAFELSQFYRRRLGLLGVSSTRADAAWCGALLTELGEGFESGHLPPVSIAQTLPIERAAEAYALVATGQAPGRIVLTFDDAAVSAHARPDGA